MSSNEITAALRNVIASRGSVRVGRALVSYDGRTFGVSAQGVALSTRNRAKAADFIATIA